MSKEKEKLIKIRSRLSEIFNKLKPKDIESRKNRHLLFAMGQIDSAISNLTKFEMEK